MFSSKLLLALLGCLAIYAHAEDAVDGEILEETVTKTDDDDLTIGPSPDASLSFLFVSPPDANAINEVHSGKPVKFLIGFQNRGEKDFTVKFSETSLRYPMDFNYHVQNFTRGEYNRRVSPKEEVTLDYGFFAHESFAGRSLGLVVNLHYEDADGKYYVNNVYNQTINILEDDSAFNHETGFLLIVLLGIAVLILYFANQFLSKLSRKSGLQKRPTQEQGTSSAEVDYEWIPRDALKEKKSPGSPRARKVKKAE
ncbi:unnamed protein product [Caenorhabditis auriculariae]|uniref:Translocon-associated protein subunit alpha n=1 Tax=Caenorhabditis auriculariae TaxID=2777116 RepID=A0A8S1HTV6_9PELO|nr:unnamed protein product [Caenorhabditis auriculariae]